MDRDRTKAAPHFDAAFRERLNDLLRWRRDVRSFRREPLPDGALDRLIETACLSPSVGLSEPWRFVTVEDAARRAAVRADFETCNQAALDAQSDERSALYARLKLSGLDDAPCHVAVFCDDATTQGHGLGRTTMAETVAYSAVVAIHTLWLAARAQGIGVGWVSILDPARVSAILEVPPAWRFVAYLCIGYAMEENDVPALERSGWEKRQPPTIVRR